MNCVRMAFREVERHADQVVLIGIEPANPEPEYGYIVPEGEVRPIPAGEVERVRQFVEKPDPAAAQDLIRAGAFWNTMVLVFQTAALLALVERTLPAIFSCFLRIEEAMGTPDETEVTEEAYRWIAPTNLSKDLLETLARGAPSSLSVLAARDVTWSDWGSEQRIFGAVRPEAAWKQGDRHAREAHAREAPVERGQEHVVLGTTSR